MSYPLSFPAEKPLVTLTHPKDTLWVLELHNGQDNRLTPTLIEHAIKPALNAVEGHWREQWRAVQSSKDKSAGNGALIIVGRKDQDKFFSNGLDLSLVPPNGNFFPEIYNPLLERLLKFPIPTICAINGHCFAGGFMLSLACDYRVMIDGSKRNAWLCMNEVDFGAVWPHSFAGVLSAKITNAQVRRKIALEGHRFTPTEALDSGIVDALGGGTTATVLAKAEELALTVGVKAQGGVWGLIKNDIYWDALQGTKRDPRMTNPMVDDAAAQTRLFSKL
ncbi:ClpP/crotonase-like domain-containing protein [Roridomyces roridus]|uniref:ClpP/crotonase-like domain-containing protein n=1 Tax=Roridomyces roridus TaxID=1738132 RepID=A0AAD7CJQ7_9AGAR|nr:ClpP/crotonase-like domain-containing protein [Roridomyces roridus]